MASVLVSALCVEVIPIASIARVFTMLLHSAEAMALGIPRAANELARLLCFWLVWWLMTFLHHFISKKSISSWPRAVLGGR